MDFCSTFTGQQQNYIGLSITFDNAKLVLFDWVAISAVAMYLYGVKIVGLVCSVEEGRVHEKSMSDDSM